MKTARASYLFWTIAFLLLSLPILPLLIDHLADNPNRNDARLIVWILDWVWYSLLHAPDMIAEGPINFPAPAQLTSSDWFYSAQTVFGPIHVWTGNPVLAANLTAWLTYPLAAFCMERLARRLGSDPLPAITAGLFFALASRRIPFNIHILQNANFLLPLVALAVLSLFDRPDLRRTLAATAAFLLACLSALYGAFFAAVTGAIALAAAWCRPTASRGRATVYALLAAGIAGGIAAITLRPWLARATDELRPLVIADANLANYGSALLGISRVDPVSAINFALPVVFLGALLAAVVQRGVRVGVAFGVSMWLLGALLSPGYPKALESVLAGSPLSFLAYPDRQQIVADVGRAILLSLALTGLRSLPFRSLPLRGLQTSACGLVAILLLVVRGTALVDGNFSRPLAFGIDRPAYLALQAALQRARGSSARVTSGPLLELPLRRPNPNGRAKGTPVAPDAMLGQTIHRIPLVDGYTGYHPPHRAFLLDAIGRLPSGLALADLQRATGLEWILLRPEAEWQGYPTKRASVIDLLRKSPEVEEISDLGGWTLAHLRVPSSSDWRQAIAAGTGRNQTALGYPAVPLTAASTSGELNVQASPSAGRANQYLPLDVTLTNTGETPWPGSLRPRRAWMLDFGTTRPRGRFQEGVLQRPTPFPAEKSVVLAIRWKPLDEGAKAQPAQLVPLPRDLPNGESVRFPVLLRYPKGSGSYSFSLQPSQILEGKPVALPVAAETRRVRVTP